MEALHVLDRSGALVGRQFDLSRDPAGRVRFETIAFTSEERTRLEEALAPFARTSDFVHAIRIVGEFASSGSDVPTPSTVVVRDVELTQDANPLLEALRQHIANLEISHVVNRLMSGSREARLLASLMQDLLLRFDSKTLRRLNPGAHAVLDTMGSTGSATRTMAAEFCSERPQTTTSQHRSDPVPIRPSRS